MLIALVSVASATLFDRPLDPAALAAIADATAFGDVTEIRTVWDGGLIWTVATLDLVDLDARADVWIPGGCIANVCLTVPGAPWVAEGERVYVFLRDDQPAGLSQGLFHVHGDVARRDTADLAFRDGARAREVYALRELR